MTKTEYSMLCALCIALSAAVQLAFSDFGADCACYFAVFICAACCPLNYGILAAVLCPLVSLMTVGNPAAVLYPAGAVKCLVFLFLSKFLFRRINTGKLLTNLYICLVPSVCTGQIVDAVISTAIFCGDVNSAVAFALEKLIASLPGIIVLFAVTPGTVMLLKNLGIIEE